MMKGQGHRAKVIDLVTARIMQKVEMGGQHFLVFYTSNESL